MEKPILISGIQPTGNLHLGNYLGALKNFVELQNSGKYECFFFIADLHSITENFDPKEKSKQILNLALDYLSAGLNPEKSVIFVQSQIPAHAELAWIFNTITPVGELSRMTQFKEKSENQKSNVNVGLFTYPVLQTADVLLYDAEFIPVGEDQLQHIELMRTIARKFNGKFGKTFIEPKPLLTEVPRLMSLDDSKKKMSKSRPVGCLFLDDSPRMIEEKIKTAVTDSGKEIKYSLKTKPALSNLILIYSALSGYTTQSIERQFQDKGYADFKKSLAEIIIDALGPFQDEKKYLSRNIPHIKKILEDGRKKAEKITNKKIEEVKKKIGLFV